ncbi:MAG: outer membrane protein transport protein, partial [Planctomycetia bacterium]|nr:outer membrane protein transport protein [Planctomycetia bacterium]
MKTQSFISSLILFSLILLMSVSSVFAQGVAFRGAGAVNESMGGAAAACPLSATGALYWNPATMNAFHGTTVDVDLGLALPETTISSRLPDAMGGFGGSETKSDTGAVPIPNVAIIRHYDDSPFAFGFSFGAVGGARTNYTDSHLTENPILSNDTLPNGMKVGYGNLNSSIQLLQIAANLSYAVTDKFSLSIGPTLTMGEVSCDPLYVIEGHSTPDTAIHGAGNRYVFGAGFQVGFYYDTKMGWSFGGSYKSPNWIEDIEYQSNHHENTELKLDYPSIITLGACWYGWDKWTFAWDVRYFLY